MNKQISYIIGTALIILAIMLTIFNTTLTSIILSEILSLVALFLFSRLNLKSLDKYIIVFCSILVIMFFGGILNAIVINGNNNLMPVLCYQDVTCFNDNSHFHYNLNESNNIRFSYLSDIVPINIHYENLVMICSIGDFIIISGFIYMFVELIIMIREIIKLKQNEKEKTIN